GCHVLPRLVPDGSDRELNLQRVNQLDIADAARRLLHRRGDAFVALASEAYRPVDRGALADLLLPFGADLGEVVGKDETGARPVGPVNHYDILVRQLDAFVERGEAGVAPLGDGGEVDPRQYLGADFQPRGH